MIASLRVTLPILIFAILAEWPAVAGQAVDGSVARWRGAVVQVQVKKGAGRDANVGTGFVISIGADVTTILTARHLFTPAAGEPAFTPEPWVTFWVDPLRAHPVRLAKSAPNLDVAVVEIATALVPASRVPRMLVRAENLPEKQDVYIIGSETDLWPVVGNTTVATKVKDRLDLFVYTGRGLRGGFSGAPAFDANGELAGVHLGALDEEPTFGRGAKILDVIAVMKALGVPLANLDLPFVEPSSDGVVPDLDAAWNFPVSALTPGMLEACRRELTTPVGSAAFYGGAPQRPLVLYGTLQTEPGQFQRCILHSDEEREKIVPGSVSMTFVHRDDTFGDEPVARVTLTPNAGTSELRGRLTDVKSGSAVPVVLERGRLLPMASHCQDATGSRQAGDGLATIRVQVTDAAGSTLPGVPVYIARENTVRQDFAFERQTDIDGIRQVTAAAGSYRLSVHLPGFGSEVVEGLRVNADSIVTVRCTLHRLQP